MEGSDLTIGRVDGLLGVASSSILHEGHAHPTLDRRSNPSRSSPSALTPRWACPLDSDVEVTLRFARRLPRQR